MPFFDLPSGSGGGSPMLSGNGAPGSSLGSVGDMYFDQTNLMVYGPKTSSGWGSGFSLVGNQTDASALTTGTLADARLSSNVSMVGHNHVIADITDFDTHDHVKSDITDLSTGDLDLNGNKCLFANVYTATTDLPSATTYHGMFAHVHEEGAAYFAHAGNWVQLAKSSDLTTVNGLSGDVTISAGNNVTVSEDGQEITISSAGAVPSVNALTGDLIIAAGANVNISSSGTTITIAATSGAEFVDPPTASTDSGTAGQMAYDTDNFFYLHNGAQWLRTQMSPFGVGAGVVEITSQPTGQMGTASSTVTFTVTATVSDGSLPSYQWQESTDSGSTWSSLSGETTATLDFQAEATDTGNQYRVVVTSGESIETSAAATLTVADPSRLDAENGDNLTTESGDYLNVDSTATTGPALGDTWTQVGSDIDGESQDDQSGWSVAISDDGSIVAIGSYKADQDRGTVRVFSWDGSTWSQLGSDIDGEATGDGCGYKVDLSANGTTLAIGSPLKDIQRGSTTVVNCGHVRVYSWTGSTWSKIGGNIEGESQGDSFGTSLSISSDGSILAVSAPNSDAGVALNADCGRVQVYEYSSGTWTQIGSDIDGGLFDNLGRHLSISNDGSILAIGSDGSSSAGSVSVYEYSSGSWTQLGVDITGESSSDQAFVTSISGDGSIVAIGGYGNDGVGSNAGHVRVYKYLSGSNQWTQLGSDIDGTHMSRSGYSVALSDDGSIVAIGAYIGMSDSNTDTGYVKVYEYISGSWTQAGDAIDGTTAGDHFGTSVAISADGETVAVGARLAHAGNVSDSGHVKVYGNSSSGGGSTNVTVTWTTVPTDDAYTDETWPKTITYNAAASASSGSVAYRWQYGFPPLQAYSTSTDLTNHVPGDWVFMDTDAAAAGSNGWSQKDVVYSSSMSEFGASYRAAVYIDGRLFGYSKAAHLQRISGRNMFEADAMATVKRIVDAAGGTTNFMVTHPSTPSNYDWTTFWELRYVHRSTGEFFGDWIVADQHSLSSWPHYPNAWHDAGDEVSVPVIGYTSSGSYYLFDRNGFDDSDDHPSSNLYMPIWRIRTAARVNNYNTELGVSQYWGWGCIQSPEDSYAFNDEIEFAASFANEHYEDNANLNINATQRPSSITWQKSTNDGSSWSDLSSSAGTFSKVDYNYGYTRGTLTLANASSIAAGTLYRARASLSGKADVYSQAAEVLATQSSVTMSFATTGQPTDAPVQGSSRNNSSSITWYAYAEFEAEGELSDGSSPSYSWERSLDNGSTWSDATEHISISTSSDGKKLTIVDIEDFNNTYNDIRTQLFRCVISDPTGRVSDVTSNSAKVKSNWAWHYNAGTTTDGNNNYVSGIWSFENVDVERFAYGLRVLTSPTFIPTFTGPGYLMNYQYTPVWEWKGTFLQDTNNQNVTEEFSGTSSKLWGFNTPTTDDYYSSTADDDDMPSGSYVAMTDQMTYTDNSGNSQTVDLQETAELEPLAITNTLFLNVVASSTAVVISSNESANFQATPQYWFSNYNPVNMVTVNTLQWQSKESGVWTNLASGNNTNFSHTPGSGVNTNLGDGSQLRLLVEIQYGQTTIEEASETITLFINN